MLPFKYKLLNFSFCDHFVELTFFYTQWWRFCQRISGNVRFVSNIVSWDSVIKEPSRKLNYTFFFLLSGNKLRIKPVWSKNAMDWWKNCVQGRICDLFFLLYIFFLFVFVFKCNRLIQISPFLHLQWKKYGHTSQPAKMRVRASLLMHSSFC